MMNPPAIPFTFRVFDKPSHSLDQGVFAAHLLKDNWDDRGQFKTLFHLSVFDENGQGWRVGEVKIGEFGLEGSAKAGPGKRAPGLPHEFEKLDLSFFSLGQDASYYEALRDLPAYLRVAITTGLRDVVEDSELWRRVLNEDVTRVSLLRSVSVKSVSEQHRRIMRGGAKLTSFMFDFAPPRTRHGAPTPPLLSFKVSPDSFPPTNLHVLIGGNGVGKTTTLNRMAKALASGGPHQPVYGEFTSASGEKDHDVFANVVSVSFSAFDEFDIFDNDWEIRSGIKHSYIGLKEYDGPPKRADKPKSPGQLSRELELSAANCLKGARFDRWRRALRSLEVDPIFADFRISERLASAAGESGVGNGFTEFSINELSSGHKIVLLTIARLVETVEEKTLVLLDEPESHLHPPLLSAFVRALSDILENRNGVAIISTHSPVVLQEVPRTCVWKLRKIGIDFAAERPEIETFGENIGVLTREVFRLEVQRTGFHQMLREIATESETYEEAVARFDNQLGGEGRGILRALILAKEMEGGGA